MLTIRLYKPKDYKKVLNFMKSVDKDFKPPIDSREGGLKKYFDDILKKNYNIYLLEKYKFFLFFPKIIGVVMFYKDSNGEQVIKYIAIAKEYRGQGHGTEMMEMALRNIIKSKRVILRTWLTNKVAISLYKKFGFQIYRILDEKDRLGEDKSIYMKLREEQVDLQE
ncbi:MAG: N-acetyltransferase [Candidatus Altiarchaeota archaeon]